MKLIERGKDFLNNEYEIERNWSTKTLIRKIANLYADDEWFQEANHYSILNFTELKDYLKNEYDAEENKLNDCRSYWELSEYAEELSGGWEYFFRDKKSFIDFEIDVLSDSDMSDYDLINEYNKMNVNDSPYSPYTTFKCVFGAGLDTRGQSKIYLAE